MCYTRKRSKVGIGDITLASFDFTCQDCGNVFMEIQRFEDPLPVCPKCKSTDTLRHFPSPAVHIFYSPKHPRYKRGMCGKPIKPTVEPQFRNGVGPKKGG